MASSKLSTVLLVSARMGAGHEGASRELARRITERGHRAVVVDFLDAFLTPLSRAWEWFYRFELRYMPESYEQSYQWFYRFPRLWGPFVSFERLLSGRRVLRWVDDVRPDVIVSTYSFATLVLGRLREEGRIDVPVVNYLTDFGVHPRAVHPAADVNLALHEVAARRAADLAPSPTVVGGAAVAPAFLAELPARADVRARLGVADDERLVLVVSGSWGIGGDLADTVATIRASGRYRVVTVCGSDRRLRADLERRNLDIVVGWTDEMPALMSAADVLVENAGGLTSLEAFAAGVPVVSYKPIPGHGRENVAAMALAGVTTAPDDAGGLLAALDRLTTDPGARHAQVAAGRALFTADPTDRIVELVDGRGALPARL